MHFQSFLISRKKKITNVDPRFFSAEKLNAYADKKIIMDLTNYSAESSSATLTRVFISISNNYVSDIMQTTVE